MSSEPESSVTLRQLRWWWAIAIAYAFAMLQRMAPASLAPVLASRYQLDWTYVGLFSSVYFIVYLMLQIPAGIVTDRLGPRSVLGWSLTCSAFGSLLLAFAPTYTLCLVGRAITALGDALVYSALIKATATHFPKKRFALMMSMAQMAGYTGTALASVPLLFVATNYGLSATYVMCSVALCVLLTMVVSLMPNSSSVAPTKKVHMSVQQVLVACAPTLVAFVAYYVAYMIVFASWGSVFLTTGFMLKSYTASSVIFAGVLGLVAGGVLNGTLLARDWGAQVLLAIFAVIGAVLFAVVLIVGRLGVTSPTPFIVLLTLIGICFGAISNGLTANVRERVQSSDLSFASSIHAVFANVGAALLMPMFGEQLARSPSGLQVLFTGAGIVCLVLVALCAVRLQYGFRKIDV
ncbi:nitrate/nitrite transporter [Alcaligenes faecalis]|uniref:nitrate/nitrite transporter n=1 Tax=Alcaligenes faecalis TaxID=511 RepID=UPI0034D6AE9C